MVSDPRAKTSAPAHAVLAVVLQVRDGRLQVLLWERALEPFAGAGRCRAASSPPDETLEELDPPPPRGEGRRARARAPRAARDAQRPRPQPAALGARDRLPRARPERRSTRRFPPTRAGTRSTSCRSSPSTTTRSCSPAASGCAAKLSYTNIGFALAPADVHDLRAARPLPRRARPRRLGDEPPARAAARGTCSCRPAAAASRARGRAARRRSTASERRELEITDQFAVLRPPSAALSARRASTRRAARPRRGRA